MTGNSSTSASIRWEGGRHIGRQEVAVGMIAAGVKSRVTGERTVVEEAQSHASDKRVEAHTGKSETGEE